MYHRKQQCADAVGLLAADEQVHLITAARGQKGPGGGRVKPAGPARHDRRATSMGMTVDQHLGQAEQFYIYESDGDASYVETQRLPLLQWQTIAAALGRTQAFWPP